MTIDKILDQTELVLTDHSQSASDSCVTAAKVCHVTLARVVVVTAYTV